MEKISKPRVKSLGEGETLTVKQMKANAGELLPKHSASHESVLVVVEGECVFNLSGTEHVLAAGDTFIIPPAVKHQIKANQDFTAIHIMPPNIEFDYSE